jgi:hypothetical protein
MGRVLRTVAEDGSVEHRCSNCGTVRMGIAESICCCGMKTREVVRGGEVVQMSRPVGLRCVPNPEPSPQWPSEIIAIADE